ncbi:MAG: fumarylacetoacetate hydrolase family protein [Trebonia sp.]
MRLATIVTDKGTSAARIDNGSVIALPYPDVTALLRDPEWGAASSKTGIEFGDATALTHNVPVVRPEKTFCVGLNYRSHVEETNNKRPEYPTLFSKFPDSLTGATSPIPLPSVSDSVDWEAELGIVIGRPAHHVPVEDALSYIAGMTVVNDVSMRDWQGRTSEWLAGKNFEASTPVGPVLVTVDELDDPLDLAISCEVDGEVMQDARTSELLFGLAELVSYISTFTTLQPGDLIATGTPEGVALARPGKPYLHDGQLVTVTIEGVGSCRNRFYAEPE